MEALAVEPLSGLTAADPEAAALAGNTLPPSTRLPTTRDADSEPDDFYGRTREIIGFAEPGECLEALKLYIISCLIYILGIYAPFYIY